MTEAQAQSLNLGIMPLDATAILLLESGIQWINDNTTLSIDSSDDTQLYNLPPHVRLFLLKYHEVMAGTAGVTAESIEGMSQSFGNGSKSDLLWQYAEELLGGLLRSQFASIPAKDRWRYGN